MKNKIFSIIIVTLLLALSTMLNGCSSSFWTFEKCFDCTQAPLVYQGTIVSITEGRYLHSVCFDVDLSQAFSSSGSFFAGAQFQVRYKIKDGNFCEPDDLSVYEVVLIDSPWDAGEEPVIVLPSTAFKNKNNSVL